MIHVRARVGPLIRAWQRCSAFARIERPRAGNFPFFQCVRDLAQQRLDIVQAIQRRLQRWPGLEHMNPLSFVTDPINTLWDAVAKPFKALFVVGLCYFINRVTSPEHSWWHWVVLAIVVGALFFSNKLPDAARSLGRSMRPMPSRPT